MIAVDITCRKDSFALAAKFTLDQPGITAVCGVSGTGKTTLLRALAGLEPQAQGVIRVGEERWLDSAAKVHLHTHRRSVGYVFQDARLFPHLNVLGNLDYALKRAVEKKPGYSLHDVVEWLGLHELMGRMPHRLSGGQQRRVAVARALLAYPKLLLMDEPLNGLDVENSEPIAQHIRHAALQSTIPVLYATHTQPELLALADRVIYMENGAPVFHGGLPQVLRDPALPFVHRADGCNVIFGRVSHHDAGGQLTHLETGLGKLAVPGEYGRPGDAVRIVIPMNAVSFSRQEPAPSSGSNLLRLPIHSIATPRNEKLQGVQNVVAGSAQEALAARITTHSCLKMELKAGDTVYAQIKAVAIRVT